ncbi:hypothetical protein [Kineococcus sp. SYSU DK001]|uniref:hypothetical protein n=1 Tax=Kineococcus sp. SYSU DK001 TaxID=3383122 RepID=UPI003D7DA273
MERTSRTRRRADAVEARDALHARVPADLARPARVTPRPSTPGACSGDDDGPPFARGCAAQRTGG